MKLNYRAADGPKEVTYKDHLSVVVFRTEVISVGQLPTENSRLLRRFGCGCDHGFIHQQKGDPDDGLIVDATSSQRSQQPVCRNRREIFLLRTVATRPIWKTR